MANHAWSLEGRQAGTRPFGDMCQPGRVRFLIEVDVNMLSPWPETRLGVVPIGEIRWWNEDRQEATMWRKANEFGQCRRVKFRRFSIVDHRRPARDPHLCADPGAAKLGRANQWLRARKASGPHMALDARSTDQPGRKASGLDDYLPSIAEAHAEHL